jgi:hypothetical protein
MQYSQFQKAINLAKKTGDRVIVFDAAKPDSAYVVMGLNEYERLVLGRSEVRNLTEDQLLDKINRDIAIWKSENEFESIDSKFGGYNFNKREEIGNIGNRRNVIEDMYKEDLSSPGLRDMEKGLGKKLGSRSHWSIPQERKQAAEEVISEEDRQYLEEITF